MYLFAAQCRTKKLREVKNAETDSNSDESSEDHEFQRVIKIGSVAKSVPWHIESNDKRTTFKIDTGADETIISYSVYKQSFETNFKLKTTKATLLGPGTGANRNLEVFWKIKVPVK